MPAKLDLTERLAAIVSTQESIAKTSLDPDTAMKLVVEQVRELTDADGAVIEMIHGDEIRYHSACGSLAPHVGTMFDIEGSISGECISSRALLVCDDTETDPRVNSSISRVTGSRSIIVVPLIYDDEVVGVLKVVSTHPSAFSDLDRYSLQLMAGFIAGSLAHAAQYRAKRASEERFRLLFERNLAGAFFTTPDGRVIEVNDALVSMLGFSSKATALQDQVWLRYESREEREKMLSELRQKQTLTRHPVRLRKSDGSVIDVVMNIDLVRGERETFLIGTILEVTPGE